MNKENNKHSKSLQILIFIFLDNICIIYHDACFNSQFCFKDDEF